MTYSLIMYYFASILACFFIASTGNWYENLVFQDKAFEYEFIRTVGYSVSGGADIGESFATAKAVQDGDIYAWKRAWEKTAHRLEEHAEKSSGVSRRDALLRASNYYRTAGFFLTKAEDRKESIRLWKQSVEAFEKAMPMLQGVSKVSIPYEGTTLSGYVIRAKKDNAPLLILHTGFDGTKEELYLNVGLAAQERGYNVLMFEGPGQGKTIKEQNIPFRYDWEKVVTPVVDYAETLDFIDKKKIVLMGISLGGYLAARAAAFENRLAACVLNGGIFDFYKAVMTNMPPDSDKLSDDAFNKMIYDVMSKNTQASWFYTNGMWTFHVKTPAELMRALRAYTIKDVVQNIRCPTLVIDSEADRMFKGQPEEVLEHLKSPKTLLRFTDETTAQAHCQMGAISISNEEIFTWIQKAVNFSDVAAEAGAVFHLEELLSIHYTALFH